MCTVLLPPGDNPIAVNKYINININIFDKQKKKNITSLVTIFLYFLFNPKLRYFIRQGLSMDDILSQMNPVHILRSHLFNVHFNIFPSTPRSSKWSLPFIFCRWSSGRCIFLIICVWTVFRYNIAGLPAVSSKWNIKFQSSSCYSVGQYANLY